MWRASGQDKLEAAYLGTVILSSITEDSVFSTSRLVVIFGGSAVSCQKELIKIIILYHEIGPNCTLEIWGTSQACRPLHMDMAVHLR